MTNALPRILCVDDEQDVLAGLRRTLYRTYDVTIALGAAAAIEEINSRGPFSVIVSDLNMPQIDGIQFLRRVSERAPDTAGILLTGNANLSAAIAAVNAGYIFRFLTKPCPPPQLLDAITAGCSRSAAKCAERILLSQAVDQDVLTGLPDRRRFAADVARLREREPGMALTLIVIAIDDLDLVKRTLGHAAGSTNRRRRFGRPQGEPSVSEAKGAAGPAAIRPGALSNFCPCRARRCERVGRSRIFDWK